MKRLLRISLTVADLPAAVAFYQGALAFTAGPVEVSDPALTRLLGAMRIRTTGVADRPGAMALPGGGWAVLLHDPDGHALLLLEQPSG